MDVRYMQETTDWSGTEYNVPNHIYILEKGRGGRLLGYVKEGTTKKIMFSKPFPFFSKNRTFKQLKKL